MADLRTQGDQVPSEASAEEARPRIRRAMISLALSVLAAVALALVVWVATGPPVAKPNHDVVAPSSPAAAR
ncbi:MAG TPA: hypothetical protein VFE03_00975 [Caulobacteraceae bacterium]|jgi:ferric-dicitrate binding protein FerR (iron transport regulator)|nr:hypothetical protein [Caulobacteraceae bacterium]